MKNTLSIPFVFALVLAFFTSSNIWAEPQADPGLLPAKINVNTASAEDIALALKGIGLKKAQAIIVYREKFGAFEVLDELTEVKGIGSRTLEKNKEKIQL